MPANKCNIQTVLFQMDKLFPPPPPPPPPPFPSSAASSSLWMLVVTLLASLDTLTDVRDCVWRLNY